MSWTKSDVTTPIPAAIQTALSPVQSAVSTLSPLLTAITTLLNAAKIFLQGTTDPFKSVMSTLITQLEDLVNDTFGSGMYILTVSPLDMEGVRSYDVLGWPLLTPIDAIAAAVASFEDLGDSNRPQFSDEAQTTAFGLLATAPSIQEFVDLLNRLIAVFKLPDWEFAVKSAQRFQTTAIPSVKPDWKSLRLNSFEPLGSIQKSLLEMINTLKGYTTVADNNIGDLIDIISQKVSTLQRILSDLNNLINSIGTCSGLYVLNVPIGIGGNYRIKQALRDPILENPCFKYQYTMMTLFLGGGPSLVPVDTIRQLIV